MIPKFKLNLLLGIFCFYFFNEGNAQSTNYRFQIKDTNDLKSFFRYTPDRIPLLCGHRGGITPMFPENSIAAFENTLSKIPAFFEVDPRLTKDSVVVVLHDATLDRTTNGTGKLSDYTWKEIQKLKLKDPERNITEHSIPTLDEVLEWARGKTILMLDKKDVPLSFILNKINDHNAESYVLVSSYNASEAAFYHEHNKDVMFEAFITTMEKMKTYEDAGIPWENIVAYLGQPKEKELYDALHQRGVMCIVYTKPVLEKIKNKGEGMAAYREAIEGGADILLSDKIFEVSESIQSLMPEDSRKDKFFGKRNY
ncbi:MAG: glycerophosphodiester phosphodiesterase family protein [Fulvivirga sp.]